MSPTRFVITVFLCLACVDPRSTTASGASPGVALELRYRFEEEQPIGTVVGNVARDANLARLYDPEVLRQLSFRFLKQQPPATTEFAIDPTSGVIRSAGRVDRETLCHSALSSSGSGSPSASDAASAAGVGSGCDLRLDVAVQPLAYFRIIRVSVSIVDVNDNSPRFATDRMSIEVLESAPVGATLFTPEATDADGTEFGVKSYQLITESDRFVLSPAKSSSGSASGGIPEVRLVLAKPLDREQVDRYQLRVMAVDGGNPAKSGFVDVIVSVADANDNAPTFEQDSYEASIPENVAVGTTFLRVSAVDNDLGLNGEVTYALSASSSSAHGHLFGVDALTGEMSVRGPIDFEEGSIHRLSVIARDRGGMAGGESSGSAVVPVIVHIIDLNDNSPTISVDTLSSTPGSADIAENSPMGSFVAHLSVADRDSGNNGRFACALENPAGADGQSYFRLSPMFGSSEEFQIVTVAEFDRERRDAYEITITCRDFGAEPMTSTAQVVVHVTDQNDNSPVFDKSNHIGELIENNYVGAVLLQVNATDADLGENAEVRYSIAPGDPASAWFDIEPSTGVITAGVSFDRETTDVVRFRVVARDRGKPMRSSIAHVTVAILDVNDERPTFSHPGYSFAVSENRPSGTPVGQVVARDRDGSVYGELTYYLVAPSTSQSLSSSANRVPDLPPFEIDSKTGTLTTTRILDRENPNGAESAFHFVVGASDRGVPPLSGTVNVTIYVTDENDNRPAFIFPTSSNRTVHVSARAPVNYVITRLHAHDPDVGRNARILYSIDSSSGTGAGAAAGSGGGDEQNSNGNTVDEGGEKEDRSSFFDVDAERGVVIVNRPLLEADGRIFELRVVASDQGTSPQTAEETLFVVVNRSLAIFAPDAEQPLSDDHHLNGRSAFQFMTGNRNFIIIIILAAISFAIALGLIIAIIAVRRHDRRDVIERRDEKTNCDVTGSLAVAVTNKYNCRTETIKMLQSHKMTSSSSIGDQQSTMSNQGGLTPSGKAALIAASVIVDEGTLLMRHHHNVGNADGGSRSPCCDDVTSFQRNNENKISGQSTWPSEYLQSPQAMLNDGSLSVVNSNSYLGSYPQVVACCSVAMPMNMNDPLLASSSLQLGREAEVCRLLKVLQQVEPVGLPSSSLVGDTDSDGSNADSGRGMSEVETDNGRVSMATNAVTGGNVYRDPLQWQYTDPRHRQPQHNRSNHIGSPDSTTGNVNYVGSCHTYSPNGRATHHLSTFSVSNGSHGNGHPSTPTTSATVTMTSPYFASGHHQQNVNDLSAASLDRKHYCPSNARYAPDACTDLQGDCVMSPTTGGYRPGRVGYCPAPSSPGTVRRYPVAVKTPQLGCSRNDGCLAGCAPPVDDKTMTSSNREPGQFASDSQTQATNRTRLTNDDVISKSVNPEELCNEIDDLFFRA